MPNTGIKAHISASSATFPANEYKEAVFSLPEAFITELSMWQKIAKSPPTLIKGRSSATLGSEKRYSDIQSLKAIIKNMHGKEKNDVANNAFSHFLTTAHMFFSDSFSDMYGTRLIARALVKTHGIYNNGIIMPLITPSTPVASERLMLQDTRRYGINISEIELKKLSAVFAAVTGVAVRISPLSESFMRGEDIFLRKREYDKERMIRLKISPRSIPEVRTADDAAISVFPTIRNSERTQKVRKSCSAISV